MIQHADPVLEREARFSGAQRTRLRLETGGRVFLPLAVIGLLLGWAAGDVALLFAASALAIPAVAALWAWMNGAGLELRLAPEPPHPVGEPFQFELELRSRPGPGRLRDLLLAVERPAPRPGDAPREARPSGVACELPRGTRSHLRLGHRYLRRGRHRRLVVLVQSSYPFGIWRVERRYELELAGLAWPRVGPLRDLRRLDGQRARAGEAARRAARGEDDFHRLRAWRPGMSLRQVHWKHSARRGQLLLQERRGEWEPPLRVALLDTVVERRGIGSRRNHGFEAAVTLAASLCVHHLRRGRRVQLELHGADEVRTHDLHGRAGRHRALDLLALVEPRMVKPAELETELARLTGGGGAGVVLCAGAGQVRSSRDSGAWRTIDVDAEGLDSFFPLVTTETDEGVPA